MEAAEVTLKTSVDLVSGQRATVSAAPDIQTIPMLTFSDAGTAFSVGSGSELGLVKLAFSTSRTEPAVSVAEDAKLTVLSCEFERLGGHAIVMHGGAAKIKHSTFENCSSPFRDGSAALRVFHSTFVRYVVFYGA